MEWYLLKGCNINFINGLVSRYIDGCNINDIIDTIHTKSFDIVRNYTIEDCQNIIIKYGDYHDAYIKMKSSEIPLVVYNKDTFYTDITVMYIREVIINKFNSKISNYNHLKKLVECSMCLRNIEDEIKTTKCGKTFHLQCFQFWGHNTCSICNS